MKEAATNCVDCGSSCGEQPYVLSGGRHLCPPCVERRFRAAQAMRVTQTPNCSDCGEPVGENYCRRADGQLVCGSCVEAAADYGGVQYGRPPASAPEPKRETGEAAGRTWRDRPPLL